MARRRQASDIDEAVYLYLGESKTPADVDKARDVLEQAYHAKGYQTANGDSHGGAEVDNGEQLCTPDWASFFSWALASRWSRRLSASRILLV